MSEEDGSMDEDFDVDSENDEILGEDFDEG